MPASAFASRAITHYEAALLAAFPSGSSGEVFNQWNEARRVLAAAHVQQVSVPDGFCIGAWRDALEKIAKYAPQVNCAARTELERAGLIAVHALIAFSAPQFRHARGTQTASNAAPAAPAADAVMVDMYRHLQTVTPYRFKKIQDASVTDGGDVLYFHKDRFDAALLADMAAHCAAKGVV